MKLSDLYKTLDKASRTTLAENAGISPAYLWQIATQWSGRKPSIEVIGRLIRADSRLRAEDLVKEFSSFPEPHPKESSHA